MSKNFLMWERGLTVNSLARLHEFIIDFIVWTRGIGKGVRVIQLLTLGQIRGLVVASQYPALVRSFQVSFNVCFLRSSTPSLHSTYMPLLYGWDGVLSAGNIMSLSSKTSHTILYFYQGKRGRRPSITKKSIFKILLITGSSASYNHIFNLNFMNNL